MSGKGFHVIVDGIDGSGKSTVVTAIREALAAEGKRVLDVPATWKGRGDYPTPEEIAAADVVVTAEPSTVWVGAAIRGELIRAGAAYGDRSIAQAFALDREIHYRRVVIPAREAGKVILQDRGVSSSLAYQSLRTGLTIEELSALPGNALALAHSPDALVFATLSVETALARLEARSEKKDHSRYEKRADLEGLAERYAAPWFRTLFTDRGTTVLGLSTEEDRTAVAAAAVALFRSLLSHD